jgi:predicted nucleic acid-binding protein
VIYLDSSALLKLLYERPRAPPWPIGYPADERRDRWAADVGEIMLRSLDAIHLASALSIRADLSTFIAYDHRLGGAASAAGLELLTPRREDMSRPPGI